MGSLFGVGCVCVCLCSVCWAAAALEGYNPLVLSSFLYTLSCAFLPPSRSPSPFQRLMQTADWTVSVIHVVSSFFSFFSPSFCPSFSPSFSLSFSLSFSSSFSSAFSLSFSLSLSSTVQRKNSYFCDTRSQHTVPFPVESTTDSKNDPALPLQGTSVSVCMCC